MAFKFVVALMCVAAATAIEVHHGIHAQPAYTHAHVQPAYAHAQPAYTHVHQPVYQHAQPIYAHQPAVVKTIQPALVKTIQPAYHAKHVEYPDTPAKYDFAYEVHDEQTGDIKRQQETREGDVVHGSYSLYDADGHHRVVEYTADPHNGFNAVVRREPTGHQVQAVKKIVAAPAVAKVYAPAQTHFQHAAPVHYQHTAPVATTYQHVAPVVQKYVAPVVQKVVAAPVHYAAPAVHTYAQQPSHYHNSHVSLSGHGAQYHY